MFILDRAVVTAHIQNTCCSSIMGLACAGNVATLIMVGIPLHKQRTLTDKTQQALDTSSPEPRNTPQPHRSCCVVKPKASFFHFASIFFVCVFLFNTKYIKQGEDNGAELNENIYTLMPNPPSASVRVAVSLHSNDGRQQFSAVLPRVEFAYPSPTAQPYTETCLALLNLQYTPDSSTTLAYETSKMTA